MNVILRLEGDKLIASTKPVMSKSDLIAILRKSLKILEAK